MGMGIADIRKGGTLEQRSRTVIRHPRRVRAPAGQAIQVQDEGSARTPAL